MAEEELTLILRLRDEATKQMKSARAGIIAAGAAIAAAGFTAGKLSGTRPPRPSYPELVLLDKRSRVSNLTIRLSPNTETAQPRP